MIHHAFVCVCMWDIGTLHHGPVGALASFFPSLNSDPALSFSISNSCSISPPSSYCVVCAYEIWVLLAAAAITSDDDDDDDDNDDDDYTSPTPKGAGYNHQLHEVSGESYLGSG